MRTIVLVPVITSLLLTACNLERQGFKAQSKSLTEETQEQIARNEKIQLIKLLLLKKTKKVESNLNYLILKFP